MGKASAHQRKVLAAGDIVQLFDVWGGYWWTYGPKQEPVRKATIDVLVYRGWILPGKNEHVFSGRQRMPYSVTKYGHAAAKVSPHAG
jgi:hypothetical protein